MYIYIYIYTLEGAGSIRFISVPEFSKMYRFVSVRFGNDIFPVRRGSACVFRTCSVRFGSVRFRVRFRPVPDLNGSVRFGRFGSVAHSFLSLVPPDSRRGASCMYCKQAVREKACIAYSRLLGDSLLCDHSRSSTCTGVPSMCVLSVR